MYAEVEIVVGAHLLVAQLDALRHEIVAETVAEVGVELVVIAHHGTLQLDIVEDSGTEGVHKEVALLRRHEQWVEQRRLRGAVVAAGADAVVE